MEINGIELKERDVEYWTKREALRAQKFYRQADKSLPKLKRIFNDANTGITDKISAFYAQYGVNKSSPVFETLEDGTQVVSGSTVKRVVPMSEAQKYKRLDSLKKQLNATLIAMSQQQNSYMATELKLLAQDAYASTWFEMFRGYGVGWNFDLLDPKLVNQLVHNPVNGQDFSTRVWNNRRLLANQVNQELQNGLIQGVSSRDMIKRLESKVKPLLTDGKEGTAYKAATRLMRTEITNTYNQASLQGYRDSGIVKQYEYLSILDSRTSEVCFNLDGKVFDVKEAVAGLNYPPMHPYCRSSTLAKFDDTSFVRRGRDAKGNIYEVPRGLTYEQFREEYTN